MTEVTTTYDEGEYAWVTDVLTLYSNIELVAKLTQKGMLVIKSLLEDETMPKVLVTEYNTDFKIKVCLHRTDEDNDKEFKIKIFASEEPEYIKYANL